MTMSLTKSIGKNTLGGGKKMNVDLKTYNRSTHDYDYEFNKINREKHLRRWKKNECRLKNLQSIYT
nr:MAG TPA: Major capsid protein [Microviridae sp.]